MDSSLSDKIVALLREGKTVKEASVECGCTYNWAYELMRRAELELGESFSLSRPLMKISGVNDEWLDWFEHEWDAAVAKLKGRRKEIE